MLEFLPKYVEDGLDAARRDVQRHKTRMRVKVGAQYFTLLRYSDTGFTVNTDDAVHLRGQVDLYDGPLHMGRCLIMATGQHGNEMAFEFKQTPPASHRAPLDFAPDDPILNATVI